MMDKRERHQLTASVWSLSLSNGGDMVTPGGLAATCGPQPQPATWVVT